MAQVDTQAPWNVAALAAAALELSKTYQPNQALGQQNELVSKAKELISAVQTPMDHMTSLMTAMVEASSVRSLLSFNVLQSIPTTDSISLTGLAAATGVQASLLERILRVLVGTGFITLNKDKIYSHTSLSQAYTGVNGMLFSGIYDELTAMMLLPDYFREKGSKDPDGEAATTHNPNTWRHGQEGKTVFEIMEQNPERLKNFQVMMGMAQHFRPYTGFYDYGMLATEEKGRPPFVDIGGADGTTIAKILEAHPNIKA